MVFYQVLPEPRFTSLHSYKSPHTKLYQKSKVKVSRDSKHRLALGPQPPDSVGRLTLLTDLDMELLKPSQEILSNRDRLVFRCHSQSSVSRSRASPHKLAVRDITGLTLPFHDVGRLFADIPNLKFRRHKSSKTNGHSNI